jgi:hypothetical protein
MATVFTFLLFVLFLGSLWYNLSVRLKLETASAKAKELIVDNERLKELLTPWPGAWFVGPDGKQYKSKGLALLDDHAGRLVPYAVFEIQSIKDSYFLRSCQWSDKGELIDIIEWKFDNDLGVVLGLMAEAAGKGRRA